MANNMVDFSRLDDSALITARARMRAELEQLPPLSREHANLTLTYDASTAEIDDRARCAWQAYKSHEADKNEGAQLNEDAAGPSDMGRARLLAVEVLLADPEALQNDALEGDLYILRDRLNASRHD